MKPSSHGNAQYSHITATGGDFEKCASRFTSRLSTAWHDVYDACVFFVLAKHVKRPALCDESQKLNIELIADHVEFECGGSVSSRERLPREIIYNTGHPKQSIWCCASDIDHCMLFSPLHPNTHPYLYHHLVLPPSPAPLPPFTVLSTVYEV